ncbi:alpha/beta-hydrolase [Testicularia cyperi]|uniref:Alpha/beta-hydrolase n=1 Tax=Testicularia cyperi TaxID=1882483 RepID=A0A317XUW6_9BASI|nr:alpha/beta-hydrolase [Testicularia cyperi]
MPSDQEIAAIAAAIRAAPAIIPNEKCDWSTSVPSPSVPGRVVELQIYDAPSIASKSSTQRPAIVNWHGSGYLVPRLGRDAYLARFLSKNLDLTFVDADYAKSPENPFPAGLEECIPAIRWTLEQPWFDGNLVLSGLSAGAQLAVSLSSKPVALQLGLTEQEFSKIKATIAFYPVCDSTIPASEKATNEGPVPLDIPMSPLSRELMEFFHNCYLGWDKEVQFKLARDPRVSPQFADHASFVPLFVIACEHDPLGAEATKFAADIAKHNDKHRYYFAKAVGHGFETRVPEIGEQGFVDAPGSLAKKEAYDLIVAFLKDNVASLN